jgi:hypothetical protein
MASKSVYTTTTKPRRTTEVKCKPKGCPTCGAQECIERPRFFCGQLLTDKDLDLGQRYVIEKNRLHNRYLVGDGVVCGLAVTCDPCDECSVTVAPGYAIDCCGNDIIVCDPAPFPVCVYLEKCLRGKDPGCEDKFNKPSRCDDQPKEYCLVISYSEEPSTPVTALIRDNGCKNTRCEPSRTRETFRFDLISDEDRKKAQVDDFFSRVTQCLNKVFPAQSNNKRKLIFLDEFEEASKTQNLQTRHANTYKVFCRLRDYIREVYDEHNIRCELADELREIDETFPSSPINANYSTPIFRLYTRLLQFLKDCFCEALLVPCAPCEDEGVVIACLTIQNGKILKICNTARKFVITGPALRYWLGPLFRGVGQSIERFCCEFDFGSRFDQVGQLRQPGASTAVPGAQPASSDARAGISASIRARQPEDAVSGLKRIDSLQRMLGDYAAEISKRADLVSFASPSAGIALNNLRAIDIDTFFDTDAVSAVDLYGKTASEAKEILKAKSEPTIAKAETRGHAYSTTNLAEMNWAIKPDSKIELVTDADDRVTAVRILK